MSEIERLRGLLAEATPGPWEESPARGVVRAPMGSVHQRVADSRPRDAHLIAAAVNALPDLLDVAEAARAYADFTHSNIRGPKYRARQEARDALDDALDRLDDAS